MRKRGYGTSSISSHSQPGSVKRQSTLKNSFAGSSNAALPAAMALCFASNHMAHNIADSPSFIALCSAIRSSTCVVPQRRALKAAVESLAVQMKEEVLLRLRSSSCAPVTIAIDGWTNVRQTKVTNVVLLCSGAAYYWCSISNNYDRNTADWLEQQLTPVLQQLVASGVRFSALVADNESVNGALWEQ
jgi:hypothetical protein